MSGTATDQKPSRGYKRTDVGAIPVDWACCKLGDLTTRVGSGITPTGGQRVYTKEGRPFLRSQNVGWGTLVLDDLAFITDDIHASFAASELQEGDVLLNITGASIGRSAVADARVAGGNVNQHVCEIRTDHESLAPKYLNCYLLSATGQRQIDSFQAGGNRQGLNYGQIRSFLIPAPPLAEQRAIAGALSDVDGLLGALEKLIAKKRAIKQAVMQQLLTGKTRLPGFTGKWETKRVAEVIAQYFCGPSPTCEERNIEGTEEWGVLKTTAATKEHGWDWRKHKVLPRAFWGLGHLKAQIGDVIITKAGPRHRVGVAAWVDHIPERIIVSGKMIGLRPDPKKAVPLMLAAALHSRHTQQFLDQRTTGMAESQVNFENSALLDAPIELPSIEEQQDIAAVLSDMDAEIAALERRRDKTKQIKQGMMQQLLTGRIRLVKPAAPAVQTETERKGTEGHNWAFNEAVVISTLARHFGSERFPLGRMRYTKLSYLLHRHVEKQAEGYLKKAAGPYNPKTRYAGPERIAKQNGYIKQHKGPQGHSGFIAADKIAEAETYFEKWYGPEAIQWLLKHFHYLKKEQLELLATVDMAAVELRAAGKIVNVDGVKDIIRNHPEWQAKLDRPIFSDASIAEAIDTTLKLFGDEVED